MSEILKFKVLPLQLPIDGFKFNVQLWKSIDGGKSFWYAGFGKYCRNAEEVDSYIGQTFPNVGRKIS